MNHLQPVYFPTSAQNYPWNRAHIFSGVQPSNMMWMWPNSYSGQQRYSPPRARAMSPISRQLQEREDLSREIEEEEEEDHVLDQEFEDMMTRRKMEKIKKKIVKAVSENFITPDDIYTIADEAYEECLELDLK